MTQIVRQSAETEILMNAVERLLKYAYDLQQEAPSRVPGHEPPPDWPSYGKIDFTNLEIRYRPDLPPALNGINLQVHAGERIGIVGRTGAGKSSIVTALFRLIEASAGSIIIDGIDIARMGLHDLRSKLGRSLHGFR